jgi:hypothetical protein
MSDNALIPVTIAVLLLLSAAVGAWLQSLLPDHHRTRDTTEAVRMTAGMLVTFSAVVLGLLTSAASAAFSDVDGQLRAYSAVLIQLNRELREYGGEAETMRQALRRYTEAAIADTWKAETPPPGDDYPRHLTPSRPGGLDSEQLARMLQEIELSLLRLEPADTFHQRLAAEGVATMERLLDLRWRLIESAQRGLSVPFMATLALWLAVVFACLGLTSPRNALSYAVTTCGALVLASAVFVLLEFNQPFTGFITVSSAPFRDALAHMDR